MHRKSVTVCLVLLLCFLLSACRESPVLQEEIYLQEAPIVDQDETMLDPEDEGQEDDRFENKEVEDADVDRDTNADEGAEDDTGEASSAAEVEFSPNGEEDLTASDAPSRDAQMSGSGVEPSGDETAEPDNEAGAADTSKLVVDASGRSVELPAQVNTVTAVGAAAQLVEMLGGSGRLMAADRDFLENTLAKAAFPDLSDVRCWWEGENSISDANFDALLTAAPDVCFELSGQNTFRDDQVARLEQAGIAYVVLPSLSSQDNLKQTAALIAAVLGDHPETGESAPAIASAYSAWVDSAVKEAGDKTSGATLYSLYLTGWDDGAAYQLSNTRGVIASSGSGLAMAYSPAESQLVTAFMGAANVVNESTARGRFNKEAYVYVAPMFHQLGAAVSGTQAAYYSGEGETGASNDLFISHMSSETLYIQLGSGQFPAVITANQSVKDRLESSIFWEFHPLNDQGYVTDIDIANLYGSIVGDYAIYVNPQGMCDWAAGSAESPLEAYWVACKLHGAYTLNEVKEKTKSFYQQFFHLALSDSQLTVMFGE